MIALAQGRGNTPRPTGLSRALREAKATGERIAVGRWTVWAERPVSRTRSWRYFLQREDMGAALVGYSQAHAARLIEQAEAQRVRVDLQRGSLSGFQAPAHAPVHVSALGFSEALPPQEGNRTYRAAVDKLEHGLRAGDLLVIDPAGYLVALVRTLRPVGAQ